MKITNEMKLFALMGVIVALGGGYLILSQSHEQDPNAPIVRATPAPLEMATVEKLLTKCRWTKGDPKAEWAIIEFADVECPACRRAYNNGIKFFENNPQIQLGFKHFPLRDQHPWAAPMARACEAAGLQGKFWEMYDELFNGIEVEFGEPLIESAAKKIGLDMARFEKDRKSPDLEKLIDTDSNEGVDAGVKETPTFFVMNRTKKTAKLVTGIVPLLEVLQGTPGIPTPPPATPGPNTPASNGTQ